MKFFAQHIAVCLLLALVGTDTAAQTKPNPKNLVYMDAAGVIRYTKNKQEAAFYGVNYCLPFAHGYRAVKSLGISHEKAIDQDVYHFARMGVDAFRVHMWDTEISDSLGNLLNNEHLRLFDYLLAQLKKRNIKIVITPIAYWGNGYPEPDERTPGFSRVYGKGQANVNENAIRAQEEYIRQLFRHVNPYTKTTYGADESVIAVELNNEPSHSGPKPKVTEYINRVNAALRSTGWDKPIFYNIAQNPWYADAVAKSDVNGHSFQWYPTGLVAGRTLEGNTLPHVDTYQIPFDTIPAFKNKARMVYEFDAGDVYAPFMYPAMARSFRGAGFQWATQFAYDPMAFAYANTDYQTHYLNLAYTPSKAISMLIAARVFHETPRFKKYGKYPQDTTFGPFRVSYARALSEMNTETAFYHSNPTPSKPVNPARLQHIAGVGSSPIVTYRGTGAYFLDKIGNGVWRLEVMPDAIRVRDPFGRPSLRKEVTTIRYATWPMRVDLPDLGSSFDVIGQNEGNSVSSSATGGQFSIRPGTYLLKKATVNLPASLPNAVIGLSEFYAPPAPTDPEPIVVHTPYETVSAQKPFVLSATVVGLDSADQASVEIRPATGPGRPRVLPLRAVGPYRYEAEVPAEVVKAGVLTYRIMVRQGQHYRTYPGGLTGNPNAWDYLPTDTYQTIVTPETSRLDLFTSHTDRSRLLIYNPDFRNNTVAFVPDVNPGQLLLKASVAKPHPDRPLAFQVYFTDKISGRKAELSACTRLLVRGRSDKEKPVRVNVSLISRDGNAYGTVVSLPQQMTEVDVPLSRLTQEAMLLLPRPYPDFQPLTFQPAGPAPFAVASIEKVEIRVEQDIRTEQDGQPIGLWLEYVGLAK
ncbi:membrane or secreted protein [Fibrisoma montanum]|uniref:Membrane or secreted protein n=1 Tax=Fibrisoma montanum TaxID=2305895 RepID=A0A418M6A9_9BACT|nr:cellulase family glycosylhydrolase [Fibrisoma montanum]RIV21295.1 membrane or secreted protein [Fibrisoma montanum]